jgi:PAS domain S-box-containing protein
VGELALGLMVAALAGITWWLNGHRDTYPIALWTRGWFFLFASAVLLVLSDGAAWAESLVQLLGPFFPALMLAGALVYADRPFPGWLLPASLVLGTLRAVFHSAGFPQVDHGLALTFESTALVAAAYFAFRTTRWAPRWAREQLLAPAFVGIAALEGVMAVAGLRGSGITSQHMLAWAVVGPFAILVQIGLTRESVRGRERRAEQAIRESAARYRALTENAFDLIAELDPEGNFTYTNSRYEEWSGVPTGELIGLGPIDLVHPDDRGRTRAWFRAQASASPPPDEPLLTIRLRHRDGTWRWVETSGQTFRAGGEIRIVANSRDVTERFELGERLQREYDRLEERVEKRTAQLHAAVASLEEEVAERRRVEHELRASEERWRNVSELSSDLSFALMRAPDGSLTTEWVTRAVSRITGRRRREIEAAGWPAIVHPDDLDHVMSALGTVRLGETREYDNRLITRDGGMRWVKMRVTGAPSPVPGSLRVLGAGRDITETLEAAAERQRLETRMQEAQKLESLGILAGGIAHDFNNVLTVILGNDALAMSDAEPGSRLARQLERIRSAARHAKALTSQMLTYSGNASVSLKPLDLSGLIEEISELLEDLISKQARLDLSLDHGRTGVEGDPTQLRQVILNLVTNASEALGDRPGRIAVRTGRMFAEADYLADTVGTSGLAAGEYATLEVSDPGDGIDEEVRKRIFEPFYSTKFTGRGLGLASVLGIVRSHRGAIKLTAGPEERTRFRVLLPLATGTAAPARMAVNEQRAEGRGITVLVIDDDAAVLELSQEFLQRGGLDVVTAPGGREALEILRSDTSNGIDAVVLDLAMPDLGGRETLVEIRRLRPELPVVVASGYGEQVSSERFPAEEIACFLRKPYEPDDLIGAVRAAVVD